jgi:hypothetical protein
MYSNDSSEAHQSRVKKSVKKTKHITPTNRGGATFFWSLAGAQQNLS